MSLDDSMELENEETEEVGLMDLLAQGEESANEEDGHIDTNTDDVEELKRRVQEYEERIHKRNVSLKHSKDSTKRLAAENEKLMERLEKLEARLSGSHDNEDQATREQKVQELIDGVYDDPAKSVDYVNYLTKDLETRMASTVLPQIEELKQALAELRGTTNPERQKYEKELSILRNDPDFEGFTDEQLLPFVRKLRNTKVPRPRGATGGNRAAASPAKTFKLPPEVKEAMGF